MDCGISASAECNSPPAYIKPHLVNKVWTLYTSEQQCAR